MKSPLTYWHKLWIIVRYEYRWATLKTYVRDHVWQPTAEGLVFLLNGVVHLLLALAAIVLAPLKWTTGPFVLAAQNKYSDEIFLKLEGMLHKKKKT